MKSIHTLAICLTIFLVGFSCSKAINNSNAPVATAPDSNGDRPETLVTEKTPKEPVQENEKLIQKWEYKFVEFEDFAAFTQNVSNLNEAGSEGWEMVTTAMGRGAYVKRLKR